MLRAVQIVVDEKLATPILVGRPAVIERGIKRHGLRIRIGEHVTVVNPEHDERYREYWQAYHKLTERNGVTAQYAKLEMRRRTTLIARDAAEEGRGGRLDLRHHQHHRAAPALHRSGDRAPRRRQCVRGDERPDSAGPPGLHRRYARQSRSDARSSWRRSRSSPRISCAPSVSCRKWRCCRIRISAAAMRRRR